MTKRNGRSSGEPRHVRLYEWMTKSPAWRSLDVYERQLYVEFKARYTGLNNGNIAFSGEEMAAALNCSNRPADRALRALINLGFVKVAEKGHFDWKWRDEGRSRANTYILTEYPIDYPLKVLSGPTKDFMRWRSLDDAAQAKNPSPKSRGDESTRMRGREHPISKRMGGRRTPNGVTRAPETAQNSDMDGVSTSPTYNIPQGGASERPAPPPSVGRAA